MFFTSRAYRGCWYPWLSSHLGTRNRKILVWGLPWVTALLSLSGLGGTGSTSLESSLPGASGIALCWRELPGPSSHFPLKDSPHPMHSRWAGGGGSQGLAPSLNSGQLGRAIAALQVPVGPAPVSATTAAWLNFSLSQSCFPHSSQLRSRGKLPGNLLYTDLHLQVCFPWNLT